MYICTKAMTLGGEAYVTGDPIPEDAFQPGRADKLMACGYISKFEAVPSKSEERRIEAMTAEPAEEAAQEPAEEIIAEPEPEKETVAAPEAPKEKSKTKKADKKEA